MRSLQDFNVSVSYTMSNNRQQSIYFMDFKSVQSETFEAYIDDETNGKGRRYRNRFRNKCKDVIHTNPLHQRQIPNLSLGNSTRRHGTIIENKMTLPRLHIVLIALENGESGNPFVTHVTTSATIKQTTNKTNKNNVKVWNNVEILSKIGDRKKIMEASRIPTVEKLPVWCGASRDPETAWPHHVIFMLTDPVRRQHRDLIKNLPLMHGDDREAWFFRVEITRKSSVCIKPSIMRVLTGGATTDNRYLGNTAFRNAIRGVLNGGTTRTNRPPVENHTVNHTVNQPSPLRKRLRTTNQPNQPNQPLPNSIARHIYQATLTYNNTKFRYLFYPPGIKDLDRVLQVAKARGLEPMMYDLDHTGGYMVARHGKSAMVLLPRQTNNKTRPFPPNTVPLFVEPLA
jgi:hypothetical protein